MKYRSAFISDLHLGTRDSKAEKLLTFLKNNNFDYLYIVGDFVDCWSLQRKKYWPQSHNDVIQKLLRKSRKGVKIVYITGNHDDYIDKFWGIYGNIMICENIIHETADNKKLLIIHGDELDIISKHFNFLEYLGGIGYEWLLRFNTILHYIKTFFNINKYWSLSAIVKSKVKDVVQFISKFEEGIVNYAKRYNVDGVVCGHIHTASICKINNISYYNCGDWVENCSVLLEDFDGNISLKKFM